MLERRRSAQWRSSTTRRRGCRALALRDQLGHRRALAVVARRVVHGVVERPQLDRLWQVEQIVEVDPPLGHQPPRPSPARGRLGCPGSRRRASPSRLRTSARMASWPVPCRSRAPGRCGRRSPRAAAAAWNSSTSRVLPMPASPRTCTAWPARVAARRARPRTARARLDGRRTGRRLRLLAQPSRCQVHRLRRPLTVSSPPGRSRSRSASAAAPRRRSGSRRSAARSVRREARFTESPVTVYSRCALPVPLATTWPLAMPMCTASGRPSSLRDPAWRPGSRAPPGPPARRRCRGPRARRTPP